MDPDQPNVERDNTRYQFGLSSLFVLTTAVALISGLTHYLGGEVLLKHTIFALFTVCLLLFVFIGPLLITEFLTYLIDTLFGFSSTSPMPGRRRIK